MLTASEKTSMVATIPRSGTWMFKYFLAALYLLKRGMPLTLDSVYAMTRTPELDLREGLGLGQTKVSHAILPGFTGFEPAESSGWTALARRLGSLEHCRDRDVKHAPYSLAVNAEGRIVFVYRHPFDLFVAYARRYADMVNEFGQEGVMPFHAVMPIVYPDFIPGTDPFTRFVEQYRETRFFESYLLRYLPYHVMRHRFPERLAFMSYESVVRNREASLSKIVSFLSGAAAPPEVAAAVRFTEIDRMRDYETRLGHSLSGERYFFGPPKRNHITRTPAVPWRDVVPSAAVRYASDLFSEYGIEMAQFEDATAPLPQN